MPIRKPVQNRRPLRRGPGIVIAFLFALPGFAEERMQLAQADAPAAEEPAAGEAEESAPGPGPGVEEIIVRGGQSEVMEDFKVADSVTAFSAADLVALGAANIADLAAFTPNLEIVTAGATTPTFFIRGVGLNDFNANSTGAVAIYQDDVAMNAPALQLATLFDMESVNVLRGPQGSGLARNSSAGAIKIYARKPIGQFNGYLQGEGGNYHAQDYQGAVEAPIVEEILSGRFAFRFSDRDGTMRNRCGSAPPIGARIALGATAPGEPSGDFVAQHKVQTSPPWSICGESIGTPRQPFSDISDIPTGLPDWVNDRHNWAGRGTLLFEPTLDLSLTLVGRGGRRNEQSRLGQTMGTTNQQFCLGGDLARCDRDYPEGSRIVNALSGTQGLQGTGYQSIEIKQAITQLAPCYQMGFGFNLPDSDPFNGCSSDASNPLYAQYERAVRLVGRDLARNLDDEPWKGDFNRVGKTRNDTYGVSLKSEYHLPFDLTLASVSSYDRYDRKIDIDLDFSPETLFQIITRDDGYQFYQDLDLAGEAEIVDESPVRWNVGGWVLPEKLDVDVFNDFGPAVGAVGRRNYTQRMLSMGGYGSFEFDFWDDFTLDGGVRYNWERKDIGYSLRIQGNRNSQVLSEHDVWQDPTGTIRLTYRFREDTHVYWKYNRGWKPGHYNATGSPQTGITIAEPEVIDAWETGLHTEWFGGMLGGDLSLFYYNYQNYQIFTVLQFADTAPEFVVINANDAEVYGAEIEALLRPWAGGFANVRFGWLETQFLDFLITQQTNDQTPTGQQIVERQLQNSGNPLLNSPRFKVSITAEQAIPLGSYGYLIPRYDAAWTATTYYDASQGRGIPNRDNNIQYLPKDTIAQRSYWIHGLRLGYRTPDGRLEVAGWVRNLTNEAYKTFAFDASSFFATTIYFVGDPRTYGGTVTVTF